MMPEDPFQKCRVCLADVGLKSIFVNGSYELAYQALMFLRVDVNKPITAYNNKPVEVMFSLSSFSRTLKSTRQWSASAV